MRVGQQSNSLASGKVEPFDPLKDVLMAQFAKPAELGSVTQSLILWE